MDATKMTYNHSTISVPESERARAYDRSLSTRRTCYAGLMLTWLIGAAGAIAIASILAASKARDDGILETRISGRIVTLLLPLALAVIVTFCNECIGLIHTTTLRWALWQEGRLRFNSNLRLLTSAKRSRPNAWYVNVLCIFMTAVSYTAAGGVALPQGEDDDPVVAFSLPAIGVLSLGLSSQAAVATWALVVMKVDILSWSANPLNNAFICHQHGLQHLNGFSLVSHQRSGANSVSRPIRPQGSQSSLGSSRPFARFIVSLQWIIVSLAVIWAVIAHIIGGWRHSGVSGLHRGQAIEITFELYGLPGYVVSFVSIALSLALQLGFTFTLHCTELLVNVNRDERTWRKAADLKGNGGDMASGAIRDACTSWETIILFALKIAVHWAFGEAVKVALGGGASTYQMWATCLFILAGLSTVLAIFGTFLCVQRRKGPQPTAYGHYQTLIDLVDDFGRHGSLFWGDKGHLRWDDDGTEVRIAGTSSGITRLTPIRMNALYT